MGSLPTSLGKNANVHAESATLPLPDAQLLVAREHGVENWTQLVEGTEKTDS
jgi:hypothetical protein